MNPDEEFLSASTTLAQLHATTEDAAWTASPFNWIRTIPSSSSRGATAARLVETWLRGLGFKVAPATNSNADRVVNGHPVEIKFSTRWAHGGYVFQQIRDQAYEFALLVGVSPLQAHGWSVPKSVLQQHVIGVTGQHGGKGGKDTAWIRFVPVNPPPWLRPYGGNLTVCAAVIRQQFT